MTPTSRIVCHAPRWRLIAYATGNPMSRQATVAPPETSSERRIVLR
jgi:hypothetical protein